MLCLVCGEIFNEPRFLKDLFRTKKYHICQNCLKKYPISLEFIRFPLSHNHYLEIVSLFRKQSFNYNSYLNEYSIIHQKLLEMNHSFLVIPEIKFVMTEEKLEQFDYVSTMLDKDIIVITNIFLN